MRIKELFPEQVISNEELEAPALNHFTFAIKNKEANSA